MFYNGVDAFTRAGVCLRFHLPAIVDVDGEERERHSAVLVAGRAADGPQQLEQHPAWSSKRRP